MALEEAVEPESDHRTGAAAAAAERKTECSESAQGGKTGKEREIDRFPAGWESREGKREGGRERERD